MKLKRDNAALARQFLYIAQTELSRANDTLATTRSQIKAIIGQLGGTRTISSVRWLLSCSNSSSAYPRTCLVH